MSTLETVFLSTFHPFFQHYYFRHNILMENAQLQKFNTPLELHYQINILLNNTLNLHIHFCS